MASVVELRRRQQLGAAVLQFLQTESPEAADEYSKNLASKGVLLTLPAESDQLFKKWSATMRMQQKVDELEKTVSQLKEQLSLFLAVSKSNPKLNAYPVEPPECVLTGHRRSVIRVAFHPSVLLLASCSDDGLVLIWDYIDRSLIKTLRGHTAEVHDIDFDSTGKLLASCSGDTSVKLWDCINFECLRTLYGHDLLVSSVRFLSNGEKLLSCSKDRSIRLWETATGYCSKTFLGHDDWIRTLAVGPHTEQFASAGSDHMIYFWNTEDSRPSSSFSAHDHVIEWLAFANTAMLEHLHKENKAPLSIGTPKHKRKLSTGSDGDVTRHVPSILNQAGPVLFSASRDNTIKMWNVVDGICLHVFEGHLNWVKEISIHASGLTFASCSEDRSIKIWNVMTGNCELTIPIAHELFVTCCRFGVKTAVLATGSMDKEIRIWSCTRTPPEPKVQPSEEPDSSSFNSITQSLELSIPS